MSVDSNVVSVLLSGQLWQCVQSTQRISEFLPLLTRTGVLVFSQE